MYITERALYKMYRTGASERDIHQDVLLNKHDDNRHIYLPQYIRQDEREYQIYIYIFVRARTFGRGTVHRVTVRRKKKC